ncbi:MAG: hypothetical protein FWH19_02490 [Treponema sp.]|nr:hypothetical protein [Treponema sp.]
MEKVKQFFFTRNLNEVPGKVTAHFKKSSGRDIDGFVSAVWIDKKEISFLIVTNQAVFDNSAGKFDEILTSSINDIRNVLTLEIINSSGAKFLPFSASPLPEQLRNNLQSDIKSVVPKQSKLLG